MASSYMYEGESLFTRHRHKAPVAMYVTLLDKIDRAVNGEKYHPSVHNPACY